MNQSVVMSATPTVGDLIMHYLNLEDVRYIFGIPGGGLIHLLVNLKNNDHIFQYIVCRQETGAAYIADGYYRVTGKIGVMTVTTGPGATNALTGMMNAQADGSALMLLSGEIDERFYGMGYLQEGIDGSLNINAIYSAATGYSSLISSAESAETILKQAFRNALSIPRQAVHLSLPVNVTTEPLANTAFSSETSAYRTTPKGVPEDEISKAMASLLDCQRPLLFLGNGCRQALQDSQTYNKLLLFVTTYGIPVMTTPDAKGIFPESHELSLRVYGMAGCMWPYYYMSAKEPAYDGIMIIGSQLDELSTNSWLPILQPNGENAPFIQIDIKGNIIARSFEVTQGIIGEAGSVFNMLYSLMPSFPVNEPGVQERKDAVSTIKKASPFVDPDDTYHADKNPAEPAALMGVLQNALPAGSKLFIDAGNCVGWAVHFLAIDAPSSIFTCLSMGPMGFAVGAVIGGKIGLPDATCLAITGDGAFMMQGSEVSTASHYKIGAIWLVLHDNNLNMVSQGMEHFAPDEKDPGVWDSLYELGDPDLGMFAESLGANAYTINSPKELEELMPVVLNRANNDHIPQVIIANINKKPLPPYYNPVYGPSKVAKM